MARNITKKPLDKIKYQSREPQLNDYDGDMSKRWIITYFLWNIDRQELQRKRAIISDDTLVQRKKSANFKIKEIKEWMKQGAYTYDSIQSVPVPKLDDDIAIIKFAINRFLLQIQATRKPNTHDTYKLQLNRFSKFLLKNKPHLFRIEQVSESIAHEFFDNLIFQKLSNKTIKTNIGTLFSFFEFVRKRKTILANPFQDIENLPIKQGTRIAFSDDDVKIIKEYLTVTKPDPQFWLYISFLYYGLFRPDAEARKLKISDIQQHYIQVRGEDAKNNKTQFVQIAKGLEEQIKLNNLRSYNGNLFIFTNEGIPGIKFPGEKWFYKKHQKLLKDLDLENKNYSQYSWKDTGVIALYRATKDVKLIQRMCRHGSLDQTDKYLKSLGMFFEAEILDSFPSI